eukprot:TRINITY_DN20213_c0_g1_i1.p1 TRINITY_DN20213_c0_g1~~TRINITY_DN20213_c0_g1_i1.p1  ORF type:complete len:621 (+),score=116.97 TRINITY_DN20213_c0_g1_i1:103-1965(+)
MRLSEVRTCLLQQLRLHIALLLAAGLAPNSLVAADEAGAGRMPSWVWSRVDTDGVRPAGRQGHAAVELGQRVYVIGGCKEAISCYADVQIFDTEALRWIQEPLEGEPPEPRGGHSATLVFGTDIVVFGGASNAETFGDVLRLDPVKRRWTRVPVLASAGVGGPGRRTGHAAAADSRGRVWIFGGYDADGNMHNDLWVLALSFDGDGKLVGTWSKPMPTGQLPTPRLGHTFTYIDGKLVAFGGYTAGGRTVNEAFAYDPETQYWAQLNTGGPLPGPRTAPSAVRHGHELVVAGGCDVSEARPVCYSDVWSLNMVDMRWTRRSADAVTWFPREGHSATFVRGRMFAFGGCDLEPACFNDVAVLDSLDPCPSACGEHGKCVAGQFCQCTTPGFTGHDCMQPLVCPADCGAHGACSQGGQCICDNGWTGQLCTVELPCPRAAGDISGELLVCSGHGACLADGLCKCNAGHDGADCSMVVEQGRPAMLQLGMRGARKAASSHGGFHGRSRFGPGPPQHDPDVDGKDFGVHSVNEDGMSGNVEECEDNCNFRGVCEGGLCYCQPGYEGKKCETFIVPTDGTLSLSTVCVASIVLIIVFFFVGGWMVSQHKTEKQAKAIDSGYRAEG